MSQYAHDLCVLLVNDMYGELTSQIFEALLHHGRSALPALQHATRLSLRQVKHALSVLVQQHLVFWHSAFGDEIVSYEANITAAYNLLRIGRYVKITETRVGELASTVISNVLLLGHACVGDLIQASSNGYAKDTIGQVAAKLGLQGSKVLKRNDISAKVNGDDSATRERINQTLCKLLQAGLLIPVHESHFRSEQDNRAEAERRVGTLAEYKTKGKTKKEIDALWEVEVRAMLHQWKFGTEDERSEIEALSVGKKRTLEESEDSPAEKRRRLDLDMSRQNISSTSSGDSKLMFNNLLQNDLVVRVNHDKFAVIMRNDHLTHLAEQAIGNITSQIYEKALRSIEPKLLACNEDLDRSGYDDENEEMSDLPSVTTNELAALFSEASGLDDAIGRVDLEMVHEVLDHPKKHRRKANGIQDESMIGRDTSGDEADGSGSSEDESDDISVIDVDSDHDITEDIYAPNGEHVFVPNFHYRTIRQHLLLLAQHPDCFFTYIRSMPAEPERWAINFHALRRTAVLKTIFRTIDARLGPLSTRLARICQQYGRMDDKSLQSKSLLAQKEMRARLLEMQKGGLLDLQEVPRDNSRLASRTTFLYYIDEGKVKTRITDECYKTMTRCLQRLAVEKEMVATVLEKAERSDVKGREEELLGAMEKEALRRWKAQEEMIWGEIGRVDDVIAVLRDF